MRLIDLDRPLHGQAGMVRLEGLTDTLEHEPGCLLRDLDIAVEFHGTDALGAGHVQMDKPRATCGRGAVSRASGCRS